jgi:predicted DNA-binding protein
MDENLMNLKQRMIKTSIRFIRAQRAYLKAIAPNAGKSQAELKEAAEKYLKAAEPYGAALQELRKYLRASEPSKAIAVELDHTERFIKALDKEKMVCLRRIKRPKTKAGR